MRLNTYLAILGRMAIRASPGPSPMRIAAFQSKFRGNDAAVDKLTQPIVVNLRREEILRITRQQGIREIEVHSGIIWLTGTPASGDCLLHQGERFSVGSNWPWVVQAIEKAQVLLAP